MAAYLLLLPAAMGFLAFDFLPVILVVRLSLFKTNYIKSAFVGFANYVKIFMEAEVLNMILNSFMYVGLIVTATTFVSLCIALLIINMNKLTQDTTRFVLYIPTFTSGIIIATVWRWILHPVQGLANWMIGLFGISPVMWLADRSTAILSISVMLVCAQIGSILVIILASMLSISSTIYDSARIDGAGWWTIKIRIIIPMVMPTILLMTLLGMIGTFQMWETLYLMKPIQAANNLMFDIYRTGFIYSKYGLSAAKSILLMAIVLGLSLIKRRVER